MRVHRHNFPKTDKKKVYGTLALVAALLTAEESAATVLACTIRFRSLLQSTTVLTKNELVYCSVPLFSGNLKPCVLLMAYLAMMLVASYPSNLLGAVFPPVRLSMGVRKSPGCYLSACPLDGGKGFRGRAATWPLAIL